MICWDGVVWGVMDVVVIRTRDLRAVFERVLGSRVYDVVWNVGFGKYFVCFG